jgi:DNA-binding MarR family transcriptional regulator
MRNLDVKNLQVENRRVTKSSPSRTPTEPDQFDANLEVWARELPGLDLETEYKLMMHLRYGGPPYRGKPGKLAKHLGLSTGAMTNRLDNMERRGLIRRLDDPDDRRGVIVELTDEGKLLWDRAVEVQAEKESIVSSALDGSEMRQLNEFLRRLMNAFERQHGPLKGKEHATTKE